MKTQHHSLATLLPCCLVVGISIAFADDAPAQPKDPSEEPMYVLKDFLGSLADGDVRGAYLIVSPETQEKGDPIAKVPVRSMDFQAEVAKQPAEKFAAYRFGTLRWESETRFRVWIHFENGDNDEALLVKVGPRWFVADPIHIVR